VIVPAQITGITVVSVCKRIPNGQFPADCIETEHRLNAGHIKISDLEHMRAEAENLVDEIKQSIGLLRRHL
jgi:hypothetical protein